jgi:hypothetical protein
MLEIDQSSGNAKNMEMQNSIHWQDENERDLP